MQAILYRAEKLAVMDFLIDAAENMRDDNIKTAERLLADAVTILQQMQRPEAAHA